MVFQTTGFNRVIFLQLLDKLSPKQLGFIPKGFKNNIIWNIGHILITEQMLTYGLSGLEVDKKFIKRYGKGSVPNETISAIEIEELKTQLIPMIKQTEKDLKNGTFKTYNEYVTSTNTTLKSVTDALTFNMFHEGIHLGIVMAIKKLI